MLWRGRRQSTNIEDDREVAFIPPAVTSVTVTWGDGEARLIANIFINLDGTFQASNVQTDVSIALEFTPDDSNTTPAFPTTGQLDTLKRFMSQLPKSVTKPKFDSDDGLLKGLVQAMYLNSGG